MAAPTIKLLPEAPNRSMATSAYPQVADAWAAAIGPWTVEVNAATSWIADSVAASDGYRQAAATSAQNAAGSAQNAQGQVALAAAQVALAKTARTGAEAARDSAQAAAAAAGAAAGLPSLTGNAGKFLGVNAAANAVSWMDAGQKVGDSLTTSRTPDASYVRQNAAIYLQSAFPELFASLGLIGGTTGTNWAGVTSNTTGTITAIATDEKGTWIACTSQINIIIRSTDNGATWAPINAGVAVGAVAIDTDGSGVWVIAMNSVVGGSALRRSTDNGTTWAPVGSVGFARAAIATDRLGTWVTGGAASNGLRSVDNGITWSGIAGGEPSNVNCLSTDRMGRWLAGSSNGGLSKLSVDNGLTWPAIPALNIAVTAVSTDSAGVWIAVGGSGAIYRSTNNGASFVSIVSGTNITLTGISTDKAGVWIAVGASGLTIRSSENGASWSPVTGGVSGDAKCVAMTRSGIVVAGALSGNLSRSTPSFTYDTNTQFRVPQGNPPQGLTSYIKAKVSA